MSIDDLPPFPDDIPTAPIARISLAKLLADDSAEGSRVLTACQTDGFFYLDLSDHPSGQRLVDQSEQLLSLAVECFRAPLEKKRSFALVKGVSLFGYKEAGTVKKTDVTLRPDSTEFFNIAKDHFHNVAPSRTYPAPILAHRSLVESFSGLAHQTGMHVLRTLATALSIPPSRFTDQNLLTHPSGDHIRLTHKPPSPVLQPGDASSSIGLPSHTDFGSITLLWNWLGGLQIQSHRPEDANEWAYVKPLRDHAIINLGDAMVKFSNGALKSAKHRVVASPGEQASMDRYSVVYFVRPMNEALMQPVEEFRRKDNTSVHIGGKLKEEEGKVYMAGEWMVRRAIQLGL